MNLKHATGVGTIMLVFGIHTVTGPPPAIALPPQNSIFEILKTTVGEAREVPKPPIGLAPDAVKLLGKPNPNLEDRVVAKAACVAMNSVLSGTDHHEYWDQAIRDQIPPDLWRIAPDWTFNTAVDRASSTIAATGDEPQLTTFYFNTCVLKKMG